MDSCGRGWVGRLRPASPTSPESHRQVKRFQEGVRGPLSGQMVQGSGVGPGRGEGEGEAGSSFGRLFPGPRPETC